VKAEPLPWAVYATLVTKPSDVTETVWRRVAECEDRREAEARAVMHEVKNPLEALGHLTYLALQDAEEPEKVRKYMLLANRMPSTSMTSMPLMYRKSSASTRSCAAGPRTSRIVASAIAIE